MLKNHRLAIVGIVALLIVLAAGIGSYAMAQSGTDDQAPANNATARHVDYNISLQVNGDLSAVDPNLQGVLPLNLTATGAADVRKGENGPEVTGNVSLGGLDTIVQKMTASQGAGNSTTGVNTSGIASAALADVQFVAVDKDLYVNLLGSWYDTGSLTANHQGAPKDDNAAAKDDRTSDATRACAEGAVPATGAKDLLKDQKQVGQEVIDGVTTTHYTASIDVDKALTDASAAAKSCGKANQAAKLDAARAQILGAAKTLNVEWWIDADGQVHQVKADISLNPSALAPLLATMGNQKDAAKDPAKDAANKAKIDAALKGISSVNLTINAKFSRFGEDFQVSKPDGNIKPISDLTSMLGNHRGNKPAGDNGTATP